MLKINRKAKECFSQGKMSCKKQAAYVLYLVDTFHHDAFHFRDLGFHFGQPAHLLWVIHTVLHLLSKPWPVLPVPQSIAIKYLNPVTCR
jgi:hypothetical protein